MANLQYVQENRIRKEMEQESGQKRKTILMVGLPVSLVLTFLIPIGWVAFIVLAIAYASAGQKDRVKEVGADGEDYTLSVLKGLPETYTIFNQLELPDARSRTGSRELDFVVVGPNGVFVVESKNHRGELVGSAGDDQWTVHKVGRGGTPYSSTVRNPVRQVKGQVAVLNNYLKSRNLNPWITPVVSLSNNNDTEGITSPDVPVVTSEQLAAFLQGYQGRRPVSEPGKIVEALYGLRADQLVA